MTVDKSQEFETRKQNPFRKIIFNKTKFHIVSFISRLSRSLSMEQVVEASLIKQTRNIIIYILLVCESMALGGSKEEIN